MVCRFRSTPNNSRKFLMPSSASYQFGPQQCALRHGCVSTLPRFYCTVFHRVPLLSLTASLTGLQIGTNLITGTSSLATRRPHVGRRDLLFELGLTTRSRMVSRLLRSSPLGCRLNKEPEGCLLRPCHREIYRQYGRREAWSFYL